MPGLIAPYNWRYPLIGEGADAAVLSAMLGGDIAATLADTTIETYIPEWVAEGSQPGGLGAVQGRYRVDHGICDFSAYLGFGGSTSGGSGKLRVGLPKAARSDVQAQLIKAWLYVAPSNYFEGFANVGASATQALPFFPVSNVRSDSAPWQNANDTNTVNTGIPQMGITSGNAGGWNVLGGGWLVLSGRYFCVP